MQLKPRVYSPRGTHFVTRNFLYVNTLNGCITVLPLRSSDLRVFIKALRWAFL